MKYRSKHIAFLCLFAFLSLSAVVFLFLSGRIPKDADVPLFDSNLENQAPSPAKRGEDKEPIPSADAKDPRFPRKAWIEPAYQDVYIPPGAAILGKITGPDGGPVHDAKTRILFLRAVRHRRLQARIDLASVEEAASWKKTDDKGGFSLRPSNGMSIFAIAVKAEGFCMGCFGPYRLVQKKPEGKDAGLALKLEEKSDAFSCRVTNRADEPLPGAKVYCQASRLHNGVLFQVLSQVLETDSKGIALLERPLLGQVQVHALALRKGYASQSSRLSASEKSIHLCLGKVPSLRALLLSRKGRPIREYIAILREVGKNKVLRVVVSTSVIGNARVPKNLLFLTGVPKKELTLTVYACGHRHIRVDFKPTDQLADMPKELRFSPGGAVVLRGRLLRPDGKPWPEAKLLLQPQTLLGYELPSLRQSFLQAKGASVQGITFQTDTQGRFSLGGLPEGKYVLRTVSSEKALLYRVIDLPSDLGEVRAWKPSCVHGRLVLQGRSLAGVIVRIDSKDGTFSSLTKTDAEGRFTFDNVPPGAMVVEAGAHGDRTELPFVPSFMDVEEGRSILVPMPEAAFVEKGEIIVQIPRIGDLGEGEIQGHFESVIHDSPLDFFKNMRERKPSVFSIRMKDGKASRDFLYGEYFFEVRKSGAYWGWGKILHHGSKRLEQDIDLEIGDNMLKGKLLNEKGRAIPGKIIVARKLRRGIGDKRGAVFRTARVRNNGTFELGALESEEYVLTVRDPFGGYGADEYVSFGRRYYPLVETRIDMATWLSDKVFVVRIPGYSKEDVVRAQVEKKGKYRVTCRISGWNRFTSIDVFEMRTEDDRVLLIHRVSPVRVVGGRYLFYLSRPARIFMRAKREGRNIWEKEVDVSDAAPRPVVECDLTEKKRKE